MDVSRKKPTFIIVESSGFSPIRKSFHLCILFRLKASPQVIVFCRLVGFKSLLKGKELT